jgi:hypothetical protein
VALHAIQCILLLYGPPPWRAHVLGAFYLNVINTLIDESIVTA